jgi:tRNA pseudouridine55 synthase
LETPGAQNVTEGIVQTWSEREIEAALAGLRGEIEQVPPMYSAKKVLGTKLYELARRGVEIERKALPVTIHELEVVRHKDALLEVKEDGTSELSIRVRCSAGTYIRTLAESIGERLGTAAHLSSLRRTGAGDFCIEDALSLEELKERAEGGEAERIILPPEAALSKMPFVHLTTDEARKALHGVALRLRAEPPGEWREDEPVRMHAPDGRLIAIGFYDAANGHLHPRVVLSPEK